MDHKYQLVGYALLVEENFETVVKHGFVNYVPEGLILQLEITPTVKGNVKRVLGHIKRIMKEEELPSTRVAKHKCQGGCGHKKTCMLSSTWFYVRSGSKLVRSNATYPWSFK
jgi:CRISPR-associated exonuclease Cas4